MSDIDWRKEAAELDSLAGSQTRRPSRTDGEPKRDWEKEAAESGIASMMASDSNNSESESMDWWRFGRGISAEMVGGAAGAAIGLAAPVPGGTYWGAALGTGIGRAMSDLWGDLTGEQDARSAAERLADTALSAAAGVFGGKVAQQVPEVVRRGFGVTPKALQRWRDFKAVGVSPTVGQVTWSRPFQMTENALSNLPGGAGILQRHGEKTAKGLEKFTEKIASGYGPESTVEMVNRNITVGIKDWHTDMMKRFRDRYASIKSVIPDKNEVPITNTLRALNNSEIDNPSLREFLSKRFKGNPRLLSILEPKTTVTNPKVLPNEMLGLYGKPPPAPVVETTGGKLTWNDMKALRSAVGAEMGKNPLHATTDQRALREFYVGISGDIREALRVYDPSKVKEFDRTTLHYSKFMDRLDASLNSVMKAPGSKGVFENAMLSGNKGSTELFRLRRSMSPDAWKYVTAHNLRRLGRPRAGSISDDFSTDAFLTNWKKQTPMTKKALYSTKESLPLRNALDRLVSVVTAVKGTASMRNFSGTAQQAFYMRILTGGGLGLAGSTIGDDQDLASSMAKGVLAGVVAPAAAAKLLTNARFVNWLAGPAKTANVSKAVGQLSALAATQSGDVREAITDYLHALSGPKER